MDSYPHELSGGMRQRAMLAMALALRPDVLIADEPTTALDVTVQKQVLDLIQSLRDELGMAVLLITHDLGVIAETADEVAVMYAGRVVEHAAKETILEAPQHPYTWGLLDSLPRLDAQRGERLRPIEGQPPSLIHPPHGCKFFPRCPYGPAIADEVEPQLAEAGGGHLVRCHLPLEERRRLFRERWRTPALSP
jgi:peptide/nickel transport system ATP-binding protein